MREDLNLKKYQTEPIYGTFNLLEEKSFFSTKLMEIEDNIYINDKSIQYFQLSVKNDKNYGYQFFNKNDIEESLFIIDMVNVKNEQHDIKKILQNKQNEIYNTRWDITINIKTILIEYLFGKIKESRSFKSISHDLLKNNNINSSIQEYIINNIIDRYELENIELFVKYINIKDNVIYSNNPIKQYDPLYNQNIESDENKVSNANIKIDLYLDKLTPITIGYFQTKKSSEYKFDYYYNLKFKKI